MDEHTRVKILEKRAENEQRCLYNLTTARQTIDKLQDKLSALKSTIKSLPREYKCKLCTHSDFVGPKSPCMGCAGAGQSDADLWEFGGDANA